MTNGINCNNWPDDNSNPQNDVSAVSGVDSGRCVLKNCSNIQDNIFIFSDTESDNVHVFRGGCRGGPGWAWPTLAKFLSMNLIKN